jgi:hypothetical protein
VHYLPKIDELHDLKREGLAATMKCPYEETVKSEIAALIKAIGATHKGKDVIARNIFDFLGEKYVYTNWFVMVSEGSSELDLLSYTNTVHNVSVNGTYAVAIPFPKQVETEKQNYLIDLIKYLNSTVYVEDSKCVVGRFLFNRISKWVKKLSPNECGGRIVEKQEFCENSSIFLATFRGSRNPKFIAHPDLNASTGVFNPDCPYGIVTTVVAIQT